MPSILNATTTNGLVTSADNSGSLQLQTNNGTTAVTIDTSQNVGVGTATPATKLNVFSSTTNTARIRVTGTGSTNGNFRGYEFGSSGGFSGGIFQDEGTSAVSFWSNSSGESMRITSGGVLCVGTTNEDSSRANIVHSGTPSRVLRVGAESGSFTGTMYEGYGARTTTNGTYKLIEVLNGNASGLFRVLDSGNAQNTNNSYGGTSDIKLKENIVDATPKLADLCKVKVRHYNFKSKPDEKQIGVVAQELEEVFAGLVEETADKDKDGNDLGTTTKSVKYSVFVPMLIKAIQELKAELDATKAEVQALKGVA